MSAPALSVSEDRRSLALYSPSARLFCPSPSCASTRQLCHGTAMLPSPSCAGALIPRSPLPRTVQGVRCARGAHVRKALPPAPAAGPACCEHTGAEQNPPLVPVGRDVSASAIAPCIFPLRWDLRGAHREFDACPGWIAMAPSVGRSCAFVCMLGGGQCGGGRKRVSCVQCVLYIPVRGCSGGGSPIVRLSLYIPMLHPRARRADNGRSRTWSPARACPVPWHRGPPLLLVPQRFSGVKVRQGGTSSEVPIPGLRCGTMCLKIPVAAAVP